MKALKTVWDRKRRGTHYSDRMQRILGVCHDCGLLWHEERVTYPNGPTETKRIEDIEPAGTVLLTPQYEKYGLRVNPRLLPKLKSMGDQFAYALNVPSTAVEVDGNIVYIRVPRPDDEIDETVTFRQAWSIAPNVPVGSLLLGVDEDHQQLVIDLAAPTNVHAAVIGMTGSGKSSLMRAMILSAQMIGGAHVALFDPSHGFYPLSGHPSVWRGGMFHDAASCERGLEMLAESIGRRNYGLMYVFVDEVPELIAQRPKIKEYLSRLAQAGRHAGIHLVIGAQHPLSSELGPMTMRNMPVRLTGRVADRTAAYQATGRNDTGAESLRGRGDFMVVTGSTSKHFQAALVTPETLRSWTRRYPPRKPRVPVEPRSAQSVSTRRATKISPRLDHQEHEGHGGGGRPKDEIPAKVVREICRYIERNGETPSNNWVYRTTKKMMPTGGFNRDKARRAIAAAQQALQGRRGWARSA